MSAPKAKPATPREKMKVKLVVAVCKATRGIGVSGALPWRLGLGSRWDALLARVEAVPRRAPVPTRATPTAATTRSNSPPLTGAHSRAGKSPIALISMSFPLNRPSPRLSPRR